MNYLRLIRWPNLLMIIFMQVLLRYALADPLLSVQGKGLLLTDMEFAILVFSCVCIAAGGYIINDIEDVKIDFINKPEKVIVGKKIRESSAYNLYLLLSALGILTAFYLTFVKEYKYIGYINLIAAGLLYFYATTYKCIPLLGNVIVAGLTALSVWIVILPEPLAKDDPAVTTLFFSYMLFAFLISLVRELVKDMQDVAGDGACGCKTLPVTGGLKISKAISILIAMAMVIILGWIQYVSRQWENPVPFLYLVLFVQLPLLWLSYKIFRAGDSKAFGKASFMSKMIMFTGLISMLVFYFSF